jgi:hypothetical protein
MFQNISSLGYCGNLECGRNGKEAGLNQKCELEFKFT